MTEVKPVETSTQNKDDLDVLEMEGMTLDSDDEEDTGNVPKSVPESVPKNVSEPVGDFMDVLNTEGMTFESEDEDDTGNAQKSVPENVSKIVPEPGKCFVFCSSIKKSQNTEKLQWEQP